jgi:hypothetical protein
MKKICNATMKKILFAFVLVLTLTTFASGQSGQPLRIEIPVRSGTNPFNYISFGDNGLCMFYPTSNDVGKDSISWSFVMLDRNLKELWRKIIPLHEDVNYLKGFCRNNVIYLLFHDTQRNTDGNIYVFFIYPEKQIITEHKSQIPDKADVADFEIWNEYALIGYNLRKGKPGLLGFSLVTGEKRNFEFNTEDDALLLDVTADTVYKDIYAVYKVQPSSSRNSLKVNVYDGSSALRRTISYTNMQEKKMLNSAQVVLTGNGKGFVAGSYGSGTRNRRNYDYYNDYYNYYYYNNFYRRQSNYDASEDNTPVSDGYFIGTLNASDTGNVKYYSFIDFDNAYKFLNDPEALRTRKKASKNTKSESGDGSGNERDYSLDFRLLLHPVLAANGQFVLLSEAYSPEYHTMTQMVYDYYGRAIPSTYSVFDGFRYTNAFIAGFDSTGKMAWNNGMEMRDILTTYLNRKINFHADSSNLVLFYNANSKIAYKTIHGNEVVENTSFTPIAPLRATDQFIGEYLGCIEPWYGEYFLASGYESLRNNNMEDNKKNVFYLSKLAFR